MSVYYPAAVRSITDGEQANAAETAKAVMDLTARTDWLKDALAVISLGQQLRLTSQTVWENLTAGTVVYFNSSTNRFEPAIGLVNATDHIQLSPTAFWQGIIESVIGVTATIIIGGSIVLPMSSWSSIWDGAAVAGDVYLSEQVPGHLTSSKGNFGIYVGNLRPTGELLIRAGGINGYTQHIHLKRQLLASPAGVVVDPAFGVVHTIATPSAATQGWLPATNTYFPGFTVGVQIPVGCAFGYNLQHPDASGIRQVFPIIPPNTGMLTQAGVIVDAAKYVINQYGIWWMDATYGNAPWPIDYNNTGGVTNDFDLYVTKIMASSELLDLVVNQVIAQLTNNANHVSVARLKTADPVKLEVPANTGDNLLGDNTNGYYGSVPLMLRGVVGALGSAGITVSGTGIRYRNYTPYPYKGTLTNIYTTIGYDFKHLRTYISPSDVGTALHEPLGTDVHGLYGHRVSTYGWVDFALRIEAGYLASTLYPLQIDYDVVLAVDASNGYNSIGFARVDVWCVQDSTDIYTQPAGVLFTGKIQGKQTQDIVQTSPIYDYWYGLSGPSYQPYYPVGSTLILRIYGYENTFPSWVRIPADTLRIVSVTANISQPITTPPPTT